MGRNRAGFCGVCGWPGPNRTDLTHVEWAIKDHAAVDHPSRRDRERYERLTRDA